MRYCTYLLHAVELAYCTELLYCTVPFVVPFTVLQLSSLVLFTICATLVDGSAMILYCLGLDDCSTLSCKSVLNYAVLPCPTIMSCTGCTVRGYWFANQIDFSDCSDTSHLSFDGGKYSLLQMHIHSPSEHMVRRVECYHCMYCRIRAKSVETLFPSTKPRSLAILCGVVSSATQE